MVGFCSDSPGSSVPSSGGATPPSFTDVVGVEVVCPGVVLVVVPVVGTGVVVVAVAGSVVVSVDDVVPVVAVDWLVPVTLVGSESSPQPAISAEPAPRQRAASAAAARRVARARLTEVGEGFTPLWWQS